MYRRTVQSIHAKVFAQYMHRIIIRLLRLRLTKKYAEYALSFVNNSALV